MLFFGEGVAETANGQDWSTTPTSALIGSSSYFGPAGLAMTSDYTAAIVWTDSHEFKPASLWSAFQPPGAAWQAPTTAFVDPETDDHVGLQRLVGKKWAMEEVILPSTSDSIVMAGIAADDCGDVAVAWTNTTTSIVYARRYTPASGWLPTVTLTKISGYPPTGVAGSAHGELLVPYTTSEAASTLAPRVRRFE